MTELERYTDVLPRLGISYRQGDYWARSNYVTVLDRTGARMAGGGNGSGGVAQKRYVDAEEIAHLEHMTALVNMGMRPEPASRISRAWAAIR